MSAVLVLWPLSACASGEPAEAAGVAADFHAAVASHEGAAACALLAPETRSELEESAGRPCDEAVLAESIPGVGRVRDSKRFGSSTQVRFARARDGRAGIADTVFLARYPRGWKVVAAACTPRRRLPYDCTVEGG